MFGKRLPKAGVILHRTSFLLIAVSILTFVISLNVFANHVPPTIQDTNMGNLAGNERELNIVVDPNNPDSAIVSTNDYDFGLVVSRFIIIIL